MRTSLQIYLTQLPPNIVYMDARQNRKHALIIAKFSLIFHYFTPFDLTDSMPTAGILPTKHNSPTEQNAASVF